jgi:hypothetical protein
MPALFSRHPLVLQTAFSELKRQASEQPFVLVGTPGSVSVRQVNGGRFYYRQFYDARGKKAADYLGPVGRPQAEERAEAVREQITVANALTKEGRLLAQHGYVRTDSRTSAIVAALANRGLFRAGALLVGSHAYGALLNDLGVRAAAFVTEDVDVARGERLAIATPEDFGGILAESTVDLRPVPGFGRDAPTTSYKPPGRDRLRVDLLVPGRGNEVTTREVPELNAHAMALPHLAYLLEDPIEATLLGRESVVPVRVPRPEAFAWHKMLVSQLRTSTSEKKTKDVLQAAVLFAVLAEEAPDALASSLDAVPRAARTKTLAGAKQVLAQLAARGHDRAVEAMNELL